VTDHHGRGKRGGEAIVFFVVYNLVPFQGFDDLRQVTLCETAWIDGYEEKHRPSFLRTTVCDHINMIYNDELDELEMTIVKL
jgi:hypothetical protein